MTTPIVRPLRELELPVADRIFRLSFGTFIGLGDPMAFGGEADSPDFWDRGIAKQLLEPTMERFAAWRSTHLGVFTFPHSPKHLGLYQKFDYWPRTLIVVMTKAVTRVKAVCLLKFGAVRTGDGVDERFERLLDAAEGFAAAQGLTSLVACVYTGRHPAYRRVLARGFRTSFTGVGMHRFNAPGYDRPDVFLVDDWR